MYVDSDDDASTAVVDALAPSYPVDTARSLEAAESLLDRQIDCVVVTVDFLEGRDDPAAFFDCLERADPDTPVLLFGSTQDVDLLEQLLSVPRASVVTRTANGGVPKTDDLDDLLYALEEHYERSISDVRETVLEIARSLMSAAPDEIDVEVEWGLKLIGRRLDADRCLVFEYEGSSLDHRYSWSRTNHQERIGTIPTSRFPGFETALESFETFAIPADSRNGPEIEVPEGFVGTIHSNPDPDPDLESGRQDPEGHRVRYLADRDVESLLAVPIVVNWELEGVLAIEQETSRRWPYSLRQQVKTLAELIGYTLERERRRAELARHNDRLERFTAVVSHDLRNPLSVLTGYAELIEETGDPRYVDDVLESANRMEAMIDDLLELARDGADVDEFRTVDLDDLVTSAWNGVDTDGATLETVDLGTLECDPGRLRQVLENLFRNAVEHGSNPHDDGPGRVRIRVEGTADGFAVEDDGPGIPPDKRDLVFEEGFTGQDGTGLGLSIVETVVTGHGWTVTVTDGDLGGARFEFDTSGDVGPTRGTRGGY
ncbi:hypothetical protein B1756_16090 [Natrarchaeobaculum aegyptiacum]|uniref:histidine kinase n=1 Tax=Natrarchaeobaculum aegyptiacum TaxID=745377 RepID=A0A2Z2HY76_9EURY|nr:hypothetical protein B1756_16090 [Natrarchaeobaculum aegyptiacum]